MVTTPQGPTIHDAYDEACTALGEEIVQRRLMAKQFAAREAALLADVERLTAERDGPHAPPAEGPGEER